MAHQTNHMVLFDYVQMWSGTVAMHFLCVLSPSGSTPKWSATDRDTDGTDDHTAVFSATPPRDNG